jgi:diacylglycerol kinase (ATP)
MVEQIEAAPDRAQQPLDGAASGAAPASAPLHRLERRERVLVFANRNAGALSKLREESPIFEHARAAGLEPEIVETRSPAHLRKVLRERVVGRERKVVVAGGDGTLHAAVQVLAGTGVVLGILAQGTANNFATALRLPLDLPSAFRVIAEGEARGVDLGEAEGEYFTESAGVGLFADMLSAVGSGRRSKNLLRALVGTLRVCLTNESYRIGLTVDGERYVEEVSMVTVANSFRLGMGVPIAPDARLTDAALDVVVLSPLRRRELIPHLRAMLAQSHMELPKVHTLRGREIRITAPHSLRVHVDDRARRRTPVTIRVAPQALRVMVDQL